MRNEIDSTKSDDFSTLYVNNSWSILHYAYEPLEYVNLFVISKEIQMLARKKFGDEFFPPFYFLNAEMNRRSSKN